MQVHTLGPNPNEDTLCAHCEEHAPSEALSDGRAVCGRCFKDFTSCERCDRPVLKADAFVDEGPFRYEGFVCSGCASFEGY